MMELITGALTTVMAVINPILPFVSHYGWIPGLYFWSLFTIAPWFFMLARLKNMGYHTNWQSLKRLYKEMGLLTTFSVIPFAVLGVLADVVFNLTNGTLIFRELPRVWKNEFLFTQRVERWEEIGAQSLGDTRQALGQSRRNGSAPTDEELKNMRRKERMGMIWARRLNSIMPGHV